LRPLDELIGHLAEASHPAGHTGWRVLDPLDERFETVGGLWIIPAKLLEESGDNP
jgi:hypothetical protein